MQKTPLFPIYQKYQAKVVEFHGWDLPVQFSGIIQEHLTVRHQVGLFDVSHMGDILVDGPDASSFLDLILTNHISDLPIGFVRYSPLCNENGGTIDDLLVYRLAEHKFLIVVNAANTYKDLQWFQQQSSGFDLHIYNISETTAQLALQGPLALTVLEQLAQARSSLAMKYYQFRDQVVLDNIPVLLSRTGYTGEDGFEIYLPPADAIPLWEAIMEVGKPYGIMPIGLGARDTLRFEASLPLYGNELSPEITPMEAGLQRFVDFTKKDFIGKENLWVQYTQGTTRHLIGLEMIERGVPRNGYRVFQDSARERVQEIGFVTSGNFTPSLQKNLAMVYIDSKIVFNEMVQLEIRNKLLAARTVRLPFHHHHKPPKEGNQL